MFHRHFHLRRIGIGLAAQSHKRIIVTNRRQFVGFSSKLKAIRKPLVVSITHSRATLVSSKQEERERERAKKKKENFFLFSSLHEEEKTSTGCHSQRTHIQCEKCSFRS